MRLFAIRNDSARIAIGMIFPEGSIRRENSYADGSHFGKISEGAFLPLCILRSALQLPLFFGRGRLYDVVD